MSNLGCPVQNYILWTMGVIFRNVWESTVALTTNVLICFIYFTTTVNSKSFFAQQKSYYVWS